MTNFSERETLDAVQRAIGSADDFVLLHRPYLPQSAWTYLKDCLDTGWVSSAGSYVTKFEEELARFTGAKRAVAVVNGTAALQVCLHLSGVGAGDEVLCPSLTFIATANAISYVGARPHFVDVCSNRLGMSPDALRAELKRIAERQNGQWRNRETGARIAAICPMHCFGIPCDLDGINDVCNEYELPLIEDAAESLGSRYKQKHTGRFGKCSAVSFNGNKIITSGGGGAVLTDDEELADLAKHLTTTAKTAHRWEFHHDAIGWNFRLPNINAALGLAQLEVLPKLIEYKAQVNRQYLESFQSIEGVQILSCPSDSDWNYWLNAMVLDERADSNSRDHLLAILNDASYQCRPLWKPMHVLPMFANAPRGDLTTTSSLYGRTINLPSSADLAQGFV